MNQLDLIVAAIFNAPISVEAQIATLEAIEKKLNEN